MKFYTTLFLMMYSLNAAAGISTSKLDELSYKLSTTSESLLKSAVMTATKRFVVRVSAVSSFTPRKRTELLQKPFIKDGNITVDDSIFAEVTDDSNVELDSEVTCELRLSKYRYTLKERLNAFAAGCL